jgi:hypothetical protein
VNCFDGHLSLQVNIESQPNGAVTAFAQQPLEFIALLQ